MCLGLELLWHLSNHLILMHTPSRRAEELVPSAEILTHVGQELSDKSFTIYFPGWIFWKIPVVLSLIFSPHYFFLLLGVYFLITQYLPQVLLFWTNQVKMPCLWFSWVSILFYWRKAASYKRVFRGESFLQICNFQKYFNSDWLEFAFV